MKRFCSSLFIFLFFLIPLTHAEATTNTLSPDTVVQRALAYHPALKGRNEELHMATARRLQADAGLKPRLDARAQAQHLAAQAASHLESFGPQADKLRALAHYMVTRRN